jgi:hypothetical protein
LKAAMRAIPQIARPLIAAGPGRGKKDIKKSAYPYAAS